MEEAAMRLSLATALFLSIAGVTESRAGDEGIQPAVTVDAKEAKRVPAPSFDSGNPTTWETAVVHLSAERDRIADRLIEAASDATRSPDDRYLAVVLLAKLNTPQGRQFMISHLFLDVQPTKTVIKGDAFWVRLLPCYWALLHGDCQVAKDVLKSLDQPKDVMEQVYLSSVLESILGRECALGIVERELNRPDNPRKRDRRANLLAVQEQLRR
jgi:hypothetical protein